MTMVGTTLSHYKILDELGRGGMGIVYKAEDTKLGRTVALKVLPLATLGNDEDRARFFREAQAAAQLNHPNIATVYAIEEHAPENGVAQPFIAMEYIDGDTLTESIKAGPLKLDKAIRIAVEVAQALEAAHEKSIVHRDIKSGNVMLTAKGKVKVLDFGLAKTAQSTKLTQMGSTLGTIAYMSPEQAQGIEVDRRTDIWSLGVLLYEMVSARLPFASEYEQAAVYSILNENPEPLTALRADVPMSLDWIVAKMLAKSTNERYQNISDLLVDLKAVDLSSTGYSRISSATDSARVVTQEQAMGTQPGRQKWLWPSIALAAFVAGLIVMYVLKASPPQSVSAFSMELPGLTEGAISPLGDRYAYVKHDSLWIRELSSITPQLVNNSAGAHHVFWSQDGSELGFFIGLKLWTVNADGDNENELSEFTEGYINGATWLSSGDIIISSATGSGLGQLYEVPGGGGSPRIYSVPDSGFFSYRGVAAIPGTNDVVAIVYDSQQFFHLAHVTRGEDVLIHTMGRGGNIGASLAASSAGHLFFENAGIWMIRVSPSKMDVTSDPIRIAANGTGKPSLSNDGTLMYSQVLPVPLFQFAKVDDDGNPLEFFGKALESQLDPSISLDETRLISSNELTREIRIQDLRGSTIPLTVDRGILQRAGDWLADGERLLMYSFESGEGDIYVIDGSGSGERQLLVGGPGLQWAGRLSKDEEWLVYYRISTDNGRDLEYVSISEEDNGSFTVGETEIYVRTPLNESTAEFHPSGRYVSYQSDISGQWEVYVRSFPDPEEIYWSVTTGGANRARWHPNGRELYYITLDDTLARVSFNPNATNPFGEPEFLFQIPTAPGQEAHTPPYALGSKTGQLVARVSTRESGTPELVIIQNWLSTIEN